MLHVFPRARAALVVVSLMLIFLATAPIPALAATKEFALGHHNGPVTSLAFSEDAKFLAAGTEEGNVILWNLEAKRSCYSIFVAKHVNALTFTHDGTLLFTGTHQSLLRWTIASASRFENEMGESHVSAIAVSPNSEFIIVATDTGQLIRLQGPKYNGGTIVNHVQNGPIGVFWEEDNNHFLTAGANGTWRRWLLAPKTHFVHPAKGGAPAAFADFGHGPVALSADHSLLALFQDQGDITALTLLKFPSEKALDPPASFKLPKGIAPKSVAFSPDGRTAAVGADDGRIFFWDLTAALNAAGITTPPGPNPIMGPISEDPWPTRTIAVKPQLDRYGREDQRAGIHIDVRGADYLKVGVRRVDKNKITDEGRDAVLPPNEDYFMNLQPGTYVVYWRKLLDPGKIYKTPTVTPYYRQWEKFTRAADYLYTQWSSPTITLENGTATIKYDNRDDHVPLNNRK